MTRVGINSALVLWLGAGDYLARQTDRGILWVKIISPSRCSVWATDPFDLLRLSQKVMA